MSKILLAEDDTDMRRFLVKALQNAGFEVTSYDNGLSAYHRLREEPFELLGGHGAAGQGSKDTIVGRHEVDPEALHVALADIGATVADRRQFLRREARRAERLGSLAAWTTCSAPSAWCCAR